MIIRHSLPNVYFVKVDKNVISDLSLTDGAKVMYAFLCGLKNGADYNDKYLVKALGVSQRAITNRKKELKKAHLILVDQIAARVYVVYVGHSRLSAEQVKARWDEDIA